MAENPKASVTIAITAGITIFIYLLNAIWQITLPPEVIVAITALATFLIGRWTRIDGQQAKILDKVEANKDAYPQGVPKV